MEDPWKDDLLGFRDVGAAFTQLLKSTDTSKVISIEAGFGRGKTFFRRAWAEELRQSGEIVVELDAQLSDHSGDPVVTFLGALFQCVPEKDKSRRQRVFEQGTKLAALAGKSVVRTVARNAADELIEAITDTSADAVEGMPLLEDTIQDLGQGMSKMAGNMIAAQLAAEQVRQKELPEQLSTLHEAITKDTDSNRIVILIDELDRCHPDHVIALLEAMKLIFNHPGFVFCLMVNADYLENLAKHRFGDLNVEERYLDKFVDIRLAIPTGPKALQYAAQQMALELPLIIPFGDESVFGVEPAAELAGVLASKEKLTVRQIKRALGRVELALRCYSDRPIDLPLLVWMAMGDAGEPRGPGTFGTGVMPRATLSPAQSKKMREDHRKAGMGGSSNNDKFVRDEGRDLLRLPSDRFRLPDNKNYYDWAKLAFLGEYYIPEHRAILDSVARFEA